MSVWPAWEVREHESVTRWFSVRIDFADGARVDVLAVTAGEGVSIEDVRAQPPLSLDDLTALADWIEEPLVEACGGGAAPQAAAAEPLSGRARPAWPGGVEGRRLVAEEYRAAQQDGADPVLAVMCATGHSRRRSLRLIAGARDEGFLTPRHVRR
ncbi:DUF6214 family protein [Streptomyces sp. NBC_01571]|uniref:DUF6214 family protein n=1 Tax=unclassified Streptomyces TaxID=2593676 RepID=UPI00225A832C|nr:DUF6214 family protein [Streptomyces sp. NBC_01571]MCX4572846.1 DUF6214 family protein [Streptomyces sp. NBC_01571]